MTGDPGGRARGLEESIRADAARLAEVVRTLWDVMPDPFGEPMLLPRADAVRAGVVDDEPVPVGDLPWDLVRGRFAAGEGRPPVPGARALAERWVRAGGGRPPSG